MAKVVQCINDAGRLVNTKLRRGNLYTVLSETDFHFRVKGEDGAEAWFDNTRFRIPVFYPAKTHKSDAKVYIGGALANPEIVRITKVLLNAGYDAFSEWYTPGKDADVLWRDYELALGFDYREALQRPSAQNTFNFDKRFIDASDIFVMVLPCGKSAHLELGYAIGKGKRGLIYMPEQPDRWDVMYGFAEAIVYTDKELLERLNGH